MAALPRTTTPGAKGQTMMKRTIALLACAATLLSLHTGWAQANGRHGGRVIAAPGFHGHWQGHRHGHRHHHWGAVGLGIAIGAPLLYHHRYAPYYDGGVWVAPAPLVYAEPVPALPPMALPAPVLYPRNGQSAAKTEIDRRECDRWAVSQPAAMADAHIFHRATLACMDGRGYTVR